ncbi:MAG: VOC family protein [Halobacteriales archaeon]
MAKIKNITIACDDPNRLASFWAAVLDGDRPDLPPAVDPEVVDLGEGSPGMLFADLPKADTDEMPIHLDLSVDDREAAVERFERLGATVRETKSEQFDSQTNTWTVMEDPEGNGFCVVE